MEAWCRGAIRKTMPASASTAGRRSIGTSSEMPSAEIASAAPDFDDSARLPCLATGTPQPATTIAVGEIDPNLQKLLKVTEESLYLGIEKAQVGNYVQDISRAVQEHVESHGFSVVRDLVGHGVGKDLHEEPQVPNFVSKDKGAKLEAGMVIAIEPMVNTGTFEVVSKRDGWTIVTVDKGHSAHYEHTVAITNNGPMILTNGE